MVAVVADRHLLPVDRSDERRQPQFLAVWDQLLAECQHHPAVRRHHVPVSGAEGVGPAVVPGRDRHRVHVAGQLRFPQRRTVVIKQEVAAVHLGAAIAVDVAYRRNVSRAVAVFAPRRLVGPQHLQGIGEGDDAGAELDHEIARRAEAAEVRAQDALVRPVGAAPGRGTQRFRRRRPQLSPAGAVQDAHHDVGHRVGCGGAPRVARRVDEQGDHLGAPVAVDVVYRHRPRPARLHAAAAALPQHPAGGREGADEAGFHAALVVRHVDRTVYEEVHGARAGEIADTHVTRVAVLAAADRRLGAQRIGNGDPFPQQRRAGAQFGSGRHVSASPAGTAASGGACRVCRQAARRRCGSAVGRWRYAPCGTQRITPHTVRSEHVPGDTNAEAASRRCRVDPGLAAP